MNKRELGLLSFSISRSEREPRMHTETSGPSKRSNNTIESKPDEEKKNLTCALFEGNSDSPKQEVVGAVIPSDCFTAVGQSEILIAVASRDY